MIHELSITRAHLSTSGSNGGKSSSGSSSIIHESASEIYRGRCVSLTQELISFTR